MRRWLVGAFDPGGRVDPGLPARALAEEPVGQVLGPPLSLAFSGPPPESGSVLCLLDGHLDNAATLARGLGLDHPASAGPEALLAAAYGRWGPAMLERLRGEFAVFVWDAERRRGLIARDQLGVRPLFLHRSGGVLRFAGEIRQLLALLPSRPAPDPAGMAAWLGGGGRSGAGTLFEGVSRLLPGEVVMFDEDEVRRRRYWEPRFEPPLEAAPAQVAAEVRAGLERAVRRRISPTGKTAVLMSGGLDSACVAALAARLAPEKVLACSASFPEHPAADESELIAILRRSLGLGGLSAEVRPGGLLASALEHQASWGVPLLGWGDFWTLELMRAAASRGARVVLGGDGGDELFAPRQFLLADSLRAGRAREARALARELPGAGPHLRRRQIAAMLASAGVAGALPYAPHSRVRSLRARFEGPSWLRENVRRRLARSADPLAWKRLDGPRWWAHTAYGVSRGIEEMGVFEHLRRRAALAGVEARHPILDLDLVLLALRQPPRATLDPRFNRPVLRQSMGPLLPDEVRLRPGKARFESLIVSCLIGPDSAVVRELLLDPRAELRPYVNQRRMRSALFERGDPDLGDPFTWMWQVWRLVTAEVWLRAQAAGGPAPSLRAPLSSTRVVVA